MNNFDFTTIEIDLKLVARAIAKAAGPDVRDFMSLIDGWDTKNCLRNVVSDRINTNIRDSIQEEGLELHPFKRYGWNGRLLIDRVNKVTLSYCSKSTLSAIPRKRDRNVPHYLQSICHVENAGVIPQFEQMTLPGVVMDSFSDEEYLDDYQEIMGGEVSHGEGYRHIVIVYEADRGEISYIAARLLAPDCSTGAEISLFEYLKPDFRDLTTVEEKNTKKDAHSLVSVKPKLKKKQSAQVASLVSIKRGFVHMCG